VQEKANLTRIRDNQRRSRARRKEYLQSLEARWRACELQGVEASAEIQAAARKVAEENRKLRRLLKARGMGEEDIDSFLKKEEEEVGAAALEGMLETRKPCGGGNRAATSWVGSTNSSSARQSISPSTSTPACPPPFNNDLSPPLPPSVPIPNLTTIAQPSNTTPCIFGVTLITDMGAKASQEEVTAAMGCPPGGIDRCEVDNTMLLGVMDRFTDDV
jgi:hypothetical protein